VARCADPDRRDLVATLRRDAELLRAFVPGTTTLREAVAALPRNVARAPAHATLAASLALREEVVTAIPDDLKPVADEGGLSDAFARFVAPAWSAYQTPLRRYLAAKAFANWTAYQGRGVRAIVRGLDAALHWSASKRRASAAAPGALDADLLRGPSRSADFAAESSLCAVGEGWRPPGPCRRRMRSPRLHNKARKVFTEAQLEQLGERMADVQRREI
jgi:hypothetical protein